MLELHPLLFGLQRCNSNESNRAFAVLVAGVRLLFSTWPSPRSLCCGDESRSARELGGDPELWQPWPGHRPGVWATARSLWCHRALSHSRNHRESSSQARGPQLDAAPSQCAHGEWTVLQGSLGTVYAVPDLKKKLNPKNVWFVWVKLHKLKLKHFNLFPTVSQLTLNPPLKINKNVVFFTQLDEVDRGGCGKPLSSCFWLMMFIIW